MVGKRRRERVMGKRGSGFWWGFGEAAAARERVAAAEDEGLGYGVGVRWAERVRSVSHVLVEEVSVVMARRGDWGEAGVEEEI